MEVSYIAYALAAVTIFTIYMAVVHGFRRDKMKSRLDNEMVDIDNEYERLSLFAQFCQAILSLFGIDPTKQKDLIREVLRSGIQSDTAAIYLVFFKRIVQPILLFIAANVGLYVAVSSLNALEQLQYGALAAVLAIFGISGTTLYLDMRRKGYHQELTLSIPEAMDLLLICIESGLALDAALNRVCAEMKSEHPALTKEFDRTRIELSVMNDRVQALQNLADRTGILPMRSFVAAVIQTEKFGTSLVDTLRVLSEDQREQRMLAVEQKAARIPVLITLPLILFILPSLFVLIMGPPILNIIELGGVKAMLTSGGINK